MPSTHSDDSQMSRFDAPEVRKLSAWWAVGAIALTALLLIVFSGGSVDDAAAEIGPGIGHDIVAAVGDPTGVIADALPLAEAQAELTGGLSPDTELGEGAFDTEAADAEATSRIPPVTPESFDPLAIGLDEPANLELDKLLVTGDSMAIPLDSVLAQRLSSSGVEVVRDPKLGSAISYDEFLDWGQVSSAQVRDEEPDAVVMFIGAGEGYPLEAPGGGEVECCSAEYAAAYANRVRQVMRTYLSDEEARVYWLSVPRSRNDRQWEISQLVNEAARIAAVPFLSRVRMIDLVSIFTPDGVYRDSMEIDGNETIVRESDGLHLTRPGAELAADAVMERLGQDFALGD
jgi:hypothetical protein